MMLFDESSAENVNEDNVTHHTCDETMDLSRDMDQLLECSMEYINDKGSTDTVDEKLESDFSESLVSFIKQKESSSMEELLSGIRQTGNIETRA